MVQKIKTNINCGNCVAKVKPFLDKLDGVKYWEVDTSGADKILTVESNDVTSEQIENAVKKIGFTITAL